MKPFIQLLSLLSAFWLAGCATQNTSPVPATPTDTVPLVSTAGTPAKAANPVYPNSQLQPLANAQISAAGVHALEPPADLWERVRRGFAMPDLDSDLVRDREQWYGSRPDYVQRMTSRGSKYLFYIVEELERRNMPSELALLPFIESAFNPQAVSSAKAAGMWQFMPATGKTFELTQNMFRDDRRDVLASTRAALDYLQKLYGMFDDWQLALAAYNWGEGRVARAVAKNRQAGLGTRYVDLKMPMETQFYVPKLQAVKNIIADPARFNATLPPLGNHPYFQTVDIQRDIDVALAAKLADVSLDDFRALNPSASKPVLLAAGSAQILLPWDNATVFQSNLEAYTGGRLASWTAWIAPSTLKPADAAKRVGMTESELRAVNQIPPRVLIKAGSTLVVRRNGGLDTDVSSQIADKGWLSLAPEVVLRKTVVKAGKKDTVATVAQRYRISPAQVAEWNKVSPTAAFKPSQPVVLYLPGKSAPAATAKASSRSATVAKAPRKAPVTAKKATRVARN
ncbi:transglycosylase SLT domain-containing protein [Rhodoferax sp.]|uniref:transglycosylase SLT domain-containing protein n=1 Tax=Rhodoferax sp. TaxID=50421 RepID=UPI00260B0E5B|nr:transglycosylase SLT domain-containing protein [Rhodoferax sp.]MDD2924790.1 transglycosylase SLT domain-containing protein [Rhodoferax sp.]